MRHRRCFIETKVTMLLTKISPRRQRGRSRLRRRDGGRPPGGGGGNSLTESSLHALDTSPESGTSGDDSASVEDASTAVTTAENQSATDGGGALDSSSGDTLDSATNDGGLAGPVSAASAPSGDDTPAPSQMKKMVSRKQGRHQRGRQQGRRQQPSEKMTLEFSAHRSSSLSSRRSISSSEGSRTSCSTSCTNRSSHSSSSSSSSSRSSGSAMSSRSNGRRRPSATPSASPPRQPRIAKQRRERRNVNTSNCSPTRRQLQPPRHRRRAFSQLPPAVADDCGVEVVGDDSGCADGDKILEPTLRDPKRQTARMLTLKAGAGDSVTGNWAKAADSRDAPTACSKSTDFNYASVTTHVDEFDANTLADVDDLSSQLPWPLRLMAPGICGGPQHHQRLQPRHRQQQPELPNITPTSTPEPSQLESRSLCQSQSQSQSQSRTQTQTISNSPSDSTAVPLLGGGGGVAVEMANGGTDAAPAASAVAAPAVATAAAAHDSTASAAIVDTSISPAAAVPPQQWLSQVRDFKQILFGQPPPAHVFAGRKKPTPSPIAEATTAGLRFPAWNAGTEGSRRREKQRKDDKPAALGPVKKQPDATITRRKTRRVARRHPQDVSLGRKWPPGELQAAAAEPPGQEAQQPKSRLLKPLRRVRLTREATAAATTAAAAPQAAAVTLAVKLTGKKKSMKSAAAAAAAATRRLLVEPALRSLRSRSGAAAAAAVTGGSAGVSADCVGASGDGIKPIMKARRTRDNACLGGIGLFAGTKLRAPSTKSVTFKKPQYI